MYSCEACRNGLFLIENYFNNKVCSLAATDWKTFRQLKSFFFSFICLQSRRVKILARLLMSARVRAREARGDLSGEENHSLDDLRGFATKGQRKWKFACRLRARAVHRYIYLAYVLAWCIFWCSPNAAKLIRYIVSLVLLLHTQDYIEKCEAMFCFVREYTFFIRL